MTFLRRVLRAQAILWALAGAVLASVPARLHRDLLDQPPLPEYAWVRIAGVMAVVLAMLMVLVSEHLAELWWWTWSFALLAAGTATVAALNAAIGVAPGAPAWPWWVLATVNAVVGALDLIGLSRASRERPIVP
ncbi:MAG: hypothetical protein KatS3mg013_1006 [Actinomycetota bacterium]|jgi:hypothetical protein|nr:MAG: hypothetical protein KatS3mg013_1006 [Actinomycetota bacterium]